MAAQTGDLADGGFESQLGGDALVKLHPGYGQSTVVLECKLDVDGLAQERPPAIITRGYYLAQRAGVIPLTPGEDANGDE